MGGGGQVHFGRYFGGLFGSTQFHCLPHFWRNVLFLILSASFFVMSQFNLGVGQAYVHQILFPLALKVLFCRRRLDVTLPTRF